MLEDKEALFQKYGFTSKKAEKQEADYDDFADGGTAADEIPVGETAAQDTPITKVSEEEAQADDVNYMSSMRDMYKSLNAESDTYVEEIIEDAVNDAAVPTEIEAEPAEEDEPEEEPKSEEVPEAEDSLDSEEAPESETEPEDDADSAAPVIETVENKKSKPFREAPLEPDQEGKEEEKGADTGRETLGETLKPMLSSFIVQQPDETVLDNAAATFDEISEEMKSTVPYESDSAEDESGAAQKDDEYWAFVDSLLDHFDDGNIYTSFDTKYTGDDLGSSSAAKNKEAESYIPPAPAQTGSYFNRVRREEPEEEIKPAEAEEAPKTAGSGYFMNAGVKAPHAASTVLPEVAAEPEEPEMHFFKKRGVAEQVTEEPVFDDSAAETEKPESTETEPETLIEEEPEAPHEATKEELAAETKLAKKQAKADAKAEKAAAKENAKAEKLAAKEEARLAKENAKAERRAAKEEAKQAKKAAKDEKKAVSEVPKEEETEKSEPESEGIAELVAEELAEEKRAIESEVPGTTFVPVPSMQSSTPAETKKTESIAEAPSEKKHHGKAKTVIKIIALILVVAVIATGVFFGYSKVAAASNERLQTTLSDTYAAGPDNDWQTMVDTYPGLSFPLNMKIDFAELYAQNQDLVGWINISALGIDYPVMQSDDDTYYAKHNFNKNYSIYGTPYLGANNDMNSLDLNNVIYGQSIKNSDQMFSNLAEYKDIQGFLDNPIIEYSTLFESYEFVVYGVFITNSTADADNGYVFDYTYPNLGTLESFATFIDEINDRRLYDTGVDIESTDKLLTLSTTSDEFTGARLVVVARLVRDGEEIDIDESQVTKNRAPRYPQAYYDELGVENPFKNAPQWVPTVA